MKAVILNKIKNLDLQSVNKSGKIRNPDATKNQYRTILRAAQLKPTFAAAAARSDHPWRGCSYRYAGLYVPKIRGSIKGRLSLVVADDRFFH